MKKTVQPNPQQPQTSVAESSARSLRQAGADGRTPGNLSQLAATINQSPRVQTQLKLAQDLQNGTQSQRHAGLAAEINQGASAGLQRKGLEEEKKTAQPKDKDEKKTAMRKADGPAQTAKEKKRAAQKMPAQLEQAPAPAPNRTGLPDQLKAGVESLSGISLDDVKVHYNSGQPAQLNALAYAQGTDIHVAPGQDRHLAHEAWHIVQQKQGRVQPTTQMKAGVPVNDDPRLEREADVMGAQALQKISKTADHGELPRKETDGHAEGCACPGCGQMKSAPVRQLADLQELELSSWSSFAGVSPARASQNGPIQMKPCPECGKEKGHLSGCSRNKKNRGAKAKTEKKARQESKAWINLKAYRGSWVTDNDITEGQVKKFCKDTGMTIRGHASGDNSKGEQGVTTEDLINFKNWYTKEYGGWK
jgi:Domain of unknown function (DUF4157)